MGTYTIICPSCKQPYVWWSSSSKDQRCSDCKNAAAHIIAQGYTLLGGYAKLLEQVSTLQQQLDAQESEMRKMDQLGSELRFMTALRDSLARLAAHRYDKIMQLETDAKVNDEFVELQTKRLQRMRDYIARVRQVLDELEPADSLDL